MNILVTGANGQLGNELRTLARNSVNRYYFSDISQVESVETLILDITDADGVLAMASQLQVDCIINCAAFTDVERAEDREPLALLLNATAASNLSRAAREQNALLVHVSTDYVFGGDSCLPYREDDKTNPIGAYGRTKELGEKAVVESGCKYLIFRTAWLYSIYGANFVKKMRQLTSERDHLKVVFDQAGTPTYAADLAAAIVDVVEHNKWQGHEGIYHFSNEGVCSWYDFAKSIAELSSNSGCVIEPCASDEFPSKVKRPAYSVLDKSKYKQTFGMTVPYWRDSLKQCIEKLQTLDK